MGFLPHPTIAILLLVCTTATAQQIRVTNPDASFMDVSARRNELKGTASPRILAALKELKPCDAGGAPPPHGKMFIPDRYLSGGHGTTNVKEHDASQPYYAVQNEAAHGANSYLVTGDPAQARCVLDVIDSWAQARALLDYNASDDPTPTFAEVGWTTASLALAYSVVEEDPSLDSHKKTESVKWLREVARRMKDGYHRGDAPANKNNLSYWRGLAATAVGVISSDDELFKWGLAQYYRAIGQLDDVGAWPLEMARVELAVHYQSFALEPLVMIAELASRQGIDLYTFSSHGHALKDAVHFVTQSVHDPASAEKLSGSKQNLTADQQDFFSWLEFWNRRFGDAGAADYLNRPWFAARLSGSTTLYAAPPN
jgi:poly(beta-D-mannuronate) lyase